MRNLWLKNVIPIFYSIQDCNRLNNLQITYGRRGEESSCLNIIIKMQVKQAPLCFELNRIVWNPVSSQFQFISHWQCCQFQKYAVKVSTFSCCFHSFFTSLLLSPLVVRTAICPTGTIHWAEAWKALRSSCETAGMCHSSEIQDSNAQLKRDQYKFQTAYLWPSWCW